MGNLILPKLVDIQTIPPFLVDVYLGVQDNSTIDAMWPGVAVIFNQGANDFVAEHGRNAAWYGSFIEAQKVGGIDTRLGIVTQYKDISSVTIMNNLYGMNERPWVRVSSFIDSFPGRDSYPVSFHKSITIDARFCSSIPMSIFHEARQQIMNDDLELRQLVEGILQGVPT